MPVARFRSETLSRRRQLQEIVCSVIRRRYSTVIALMSGGSITLLPSISAAAGSVERPAALCATVRSAARRVSGTLLSHHDHARHRNPLANGNRFALTTTPGSPARGLPRATAVGGTGRTRAQAASPTTEPVRAIVLDMPEHGRVSPPRTSSPDECCPQAGRFLRHWAARNPCNCPGLRRRENCRPQDAGAGGRGAGKRVGSGYPASAGREPGFTTLVPPQSGLTEHAGTRRCL